MRFPDIRQRVLSAAAPLALAALVGCTSGPPPGRVYAIRRPPPDRVEVIVAAPGPNFAWVQGHWRWARAHGDWEWVPGRWERPRPGYRLWVPGHWAQDRRGWYYVEGHWI